MVQNSISGRPARPAVESAQGYMVSTFDLLAGLEVTALPFSSVPLDEQRELQRLRQAWGPFDGLPPRP